MQVRGFGIRADLPRGWEAAMRNAPPSPPEPGEVATLSVAETPVLHAGTFPLPTDRGDFGSGAVELMQQGDTFVALLEYDQEEADTPLFEATGLPRRLDPRRFHARSLQRVLPGQCGYQTFFTEGGRAFCLYVVLGDEEDKLVQVRRAEQMLATIEIEPRPQTARRPEASEDHVLEGGDGAVGLEDDAAAEDGPVADDPGVGDDAAAREDDDAGADAGTGADDDELGGGRP